MKYSVKLVLRKTKSLANNKHPLYLRIILDRKVKEYSLGATYSYLNNEWNEKNEVVKPIVSGADNTNKHINNFKNKAKKILHFLEEQSNIYTIADFDRLFNKEDNTIMAIEFMNKIELSLNSENKIGNANIYRDTRRSIETFIKFRESFKGKSIDYSIITSDLNESLRKLNNIDIPLQQIDFKFLKEYESFLHVLCGERTIHLRMRTLRAVFNRAKKEEGFTFYPFKEYSFNHISTKTKKRALKIDDLKLLFNYQIDSTERKYNSLNYFKFMYLTRGMNFTDMAYLKKSDIKDGKIAYKRAKTHKEIRNIFLFDETQKIINEYMVKTPDCEYIFPILYDTHNTAKKQKDRIHSILKKVNKDLNEMAVKLGIDKGVTTYVSRHSYATVLKYMGVSTSMIAEHLGHDEHNTQIYLDDFDDTSLKESAEKALIAIL